MKNRQVKSINVAFIGEDITAEDIEKIPLIKEYMYSELVASIKDAIKTKKDSSELFELNNSGNIVTLNRKFWNDSLEKAKSFYEKQENFEQCGLIRDLIKQSNEQRLGQNNTSDKQHIKRKSGVKKKKKETTGTEGETGV